MSKLITVNGKIKTFSKKIEVSGDKSISIRWVLFSSMAKGKSMATNLLLSEDVLAAINAIKKLGISDCKIEGKDSNDWKLVDANDVIVHLFHPEKREFYDLEKMWSEEIPKQKAMI